MWIGTFARVQKSHFNSIKAQFLYASLRRTILVLKAQWVRRKPYPCIPSRPSRCLINSGLSPGLSMGFLLLSIFDVICRQYFSFYSIVSSACFWEWIPMSNTGVGKIKPLVLPVWITLPSSIIHDCFLRSQVSGFLLFCFMFDSVFRCSYHLLSCFIRSSLFGFGTGYHSRND